MPGSARFSLFWLEVLKSHLVLHPFHFPPHCLHLHKQIIPRLIPKGRLESGNQTCFRYTLTSETYHDMIPCISTGHCTDFLVHTNVLDHESNKPLTFTTKNDKGRGSSIRLKMHNEFPSLATLILTVNSWYSFLKIKCIKYSNCNL